MKRQITFFRRATLCICLIFTAAIANAQSPVRGHIVSREDQKPLIGATVKVKGNIRAVTITDDDGNFSINAKETDVLVITSVGFANREVKANADLSSLVMMTDPRNLSEVVVTATGIRKESKKLAYAIQTIDASGLTTAREADPINSLKGNAAGLAININSEIGHSADVIIRGENGSGDRPMFVVDGVPFSSDTYNINPDDIETFTILKGPSAAALYGFQGKNGAIIISTKKGTKDKSGLAINFNSIKDLSLCLNTRIPMALVIMENTLMAVAAQALLLILAAVQLALVITTMTMMFGARSSGASCYRNTMAFTTLQKIILLLLPMPAHTLAILRQHPGLPGVKTT
jgi:TonB-dependent SusC/RagA subfamily outer membrane receptor